MKPEGHLDTYDRDGEWRVLEEETRIMLSQATTQARRERELL